MSKHDISKEELLAINKQLIEDVETLRHTNVALENKMNEARSDYSKLQRDYQNLTDENGTLKKRIDEVERDIQELIKQISTLENINYLKNL